MIIRFEPHRRNLTQARARGRTPSEEAQGTIKSLKGTVIPFTAPPYKGGASLVSQEVTPQPAEEYRRSDGPDTNLRAQPSILLLAK